MSYFIHYSGYTASVKTYRISNASVTTLPDILRAIRSVTQETLTAAIDDKDVENMRKAIDLFTHIKIKLFKNSSKYHGEVNWLLNHHSFSYIIDASGLSEYSEDF